MLDSKKEEIKAKDRIRKSNEHSTARAEDEPEFRRKRAVAIAK